MSQSGFETRVKIQQVIENQLPSFILDESPKTVDFLKQYYISQEYQGGPVDIAENLDQYLKVENLIPEVIVGSAILSTNIDETDTTITLSNSEGTKGFPDSYGLLKINDEIITYTKKTSNGFTGCIRGFSGITNYHDDLNQEEIIFSTSSASSHSEGSKVENLSSLFLKEFYKKFKYTFLPGLENVEFFSELNAGNFIREAKAFYKSKGTDESFRILFNVLYGLNPKIINLENYLIKPSSAKYIRRDVLIVESISGDPSKLVGETITKSTDEATFATISEVEIFTRRNKVYYKISLFIGSDNLPAIEGSFGITPSTKVLETVEVGSPIISVDSTIGFPNSGVIISGTKSIRYSDKSINQFICNPEDITDQINLGEDVRSSEYYYGYEQGDAEKEVRLKIIGTISDFIQTSKNIKVEEGDIISTKSLGEVILNENNYSNATKKQIFANSWIYNTSTRYQIEVNILNGIAEISTLSDIDKSSLKYGDEIEILERDSNTILYSIDQNPTYISQEITSKTIELSNSYSWDSEKKYDIRRKIRKPAVVQGSTPLQYTNSISDIQNVYSDGNEYMYVASNSLPSSKRGLTNIPFSYDIDLNVKSISGNGDLLEEEDNIGEGDKYSTITFDGNQEVPFVTGDKIFYTTSGTPIVGLVENTEYFVEKVTSYKIKLFSALSFVGSEDFITFKKTPGDSSTHKFTLFSQKDEVISPQKILRKFNLTPNHSVKNINTTTPGSTALLINGVEVINYKSKDNIYYGPLSDIKVLNSGEDYDVINLPSIEIISNSGSGSIIQPVISGSFTDIFVDQQDFDIENIVSINVSGGNGSGALFEPILKKRTREILFDARISTVGGGINTTGETIVFLTEHQLNDYDQIYYNNNGNSSVGIGSDGSTDTLINNSTYFVEKLNTKAIKLFETRDDALSGINTINFNGSNKSGIHKFLTISDKKTLSEIKVINGGTGYTNRKLSVQPSGISTSFNNITFKNHNFKNGELVSYEYETAPISGLSTENQYYVFTDNNNNFRLCDAGIGATISSNFEKREYVTFSSTGSGYQHFKYPDISTNMVVLSDTSEEKVITLTPKVRGSIIDTYLIDGGSSYGSKILNFKNEPIVKIKTGKDASIKPNIVNGKVISAKIEYSGIEYYSPPDLIVVDPTGMGTGAKLRASVSNGRIDSIFIISGGIGYSSETTIQVKSSGKNGLLKAELRKLNVNNYERFRPNIDNYSSKEILLESNENLQYYICGYDLQYLNIEQEETGNNIIEHSPIIGWAYDGNPIYGPYGHSDPNDLGSTIKRLSSGYEIDTSYSDRSNLLSDLRAGFFIEDYKFTNNGDLDRHNGRFTKTKEFPNGTYAYFATLDTNSKPYFPYFIGNTYKSDFDSDNLFLNQKFDFIGNSLRRNTFPYRVSDNTSSYDFVYESNEIKNHKAIVESVVDGEILEFSILNAGDNYKVNDSLNFNSEGTSGGGLSAVVNSLKGKEIVDLNTTLSTNTAIFTWGGENEVKVSILPKHTLLDGDTISISGVIENSDLNGNFNINVKENTSKLTKNILPNSGNYIDVYVSTIPAGISAGSIVGIGTENLTVLNTFYNSNVLRLKREYPTIGYSTSTTVTFIPDYFSIPITVDYFNSSLDELVYFNPTKSIGFGTEVGISTEVSYTVGITSFKEDVLSQSIFIEDHPFTNNQKITLIKPSNSTDIGISTESTSSIINIPTDIQDLYVVDKGRSIIGLKTELNGSEVFFHSGGTDNDEYQFKSNNSQITGNVDSIKTLVSLSTDHSLNDGDIINLTVKPNFSVGIGTTNPVVIRRDPSTGNILVNKNNFTSAEVDSSNNIITIDNHNLNTGDKIFYEADTYPSGITNKTYYVYKLNINQIKLTESYYDSQLNIPEFVNFGTSGGSSHIISLINPKINLVSNNTLSFDLSDSSLLGYEFKIYRDNEFKNEFVSTLSNSEFNVSNIGTIGIDGTLTLKYTSDIPEKLFYNLEYSGVPSSPDKDVNNYLQISTIDSLYNDEYSITKVSGNTFQISPNKIPEFLEYSKTDTDVLEYTTNSSSAKGPINDIKIISSGSGYKSLPFFTGSNSLEGDGCSIIAKSNIIGNIKDLRFLNDRFEYPSDFTLRPSTFISPSILIDNLNTVGFVSVTDSGKGYTSSPDLILFDKNNNVKIDSGLLKASLVGQSIDSISIIEKPVGLPDGDVQLFSVNNSNGVSILKVTSSNNTSFICHITTPTLNSDFRPFESGDKVFIEGIEKSSSDGTGFNSEDYNFNFLKVTNYDSSTSPHKVTIDVSEYTTNTGIAKTIQDSQSTIIKDSDYPKFYVGKVKDNFDVGEKLFVNGAEKNIFVAKHSKNNLKISGTDTLSVGDVVSGQNTRTKATITSLENNEGLFVVDHSLTTNIGWFDNVGSLSDDTQYLPDNDYYQNLSYTVKSPIEYQTLKSTVNNLLHTSGLKNFADTEIIESSTLGLDSEDKTTVVKDYISDTRVDTLYNFDFVRDVDFSSDKSKFVEFKTRKLVDYVKIKEELVLNIDDISHQFTNLKNIENPDLFIKVFDITNNNACTNSLIRVTNLNTNEIDFVDLTVIFDGSNSFLIENGRLTTNANSENLGEFSVETDSDLNESLIFSPKNPYDHDYDLKILKKEFVSEEIGESSFSIGPANLISSTQIVGSGQTTSILSNSTIGAVYYTQAQIINQSNNEINYVNAFTIVDSDGSNLTYDRQSFVDSGESGSRFKSLNVDSLGDFSSAIDDNGTFTLSYTNNTNNQLSINAKVTSFNSANESTYNFKSQGQQDSSARHVKYLSKYRNNSMPIIGDSTIDINSAKILVYVEIEGSDDWEMHELLIIRNSSDQYTLNGKTLVDNYGQSIIDNFYIEENISGEVSLNYNTTLTPSTLRFTSLNEIFYTVDDKENIPLNLEYGNISESVNIIEYNGVNGDRGNKFKFSLTSNDVPIFAKSFNPSDSSIISIGSSTFNIDNHFFKTGEELRYTPKSTFVGVGSTPMHYTQGNSTGALPSTVYAIKVNDNSFQISTTRNDANSGIAVSITSLGEGNAHQFEMSKRNEKVVISIDDVIQHPLAYNPVIGSSHSLSSNDGQINQSDSTFALSGISSIIPGDILKIGQEYMGIVRVGFGTSSSGPITNTGTVPLVQVNRGFVGTSSSAHTDTTTAYVYRGSFNIVGSDIYFTEPPRGRGTEEDQRDSSNLLYNSSEFNGRVFLRNNYDTNQIYDDISSQFNGKDNQFTLTVDGQNTIGIGTSGGNGIVLINGMYQTPSTDNNPNNNFKIIESGSGITGVSSIVFSGVNYPETITRFISNDDVNANEVPRGGIVVSLGSTGGLGYAPTVGAALTITTDSNGSINSVDFVKTISDGRTFVNHGSGYYNTVSIAVTDRAGIGTGAEITAEVGLGGTLTNLSIGAGGTNYSDPLVQVETPSYSNLDIKPISRLSVGSTTVLGDGMKMSVVVDAVTNTGVGLTYFEVKEFRIDRNGFGFELGDKFSLVGLVTDARLSSPQEELVFEVTETFTDSVSAWQFGEVDFIDSIAQYQDGQRLNFPLFYNGELSSFESDEQINFSGLLLVFVNGVIQQPEKAYTFNGGSSFNFVTAPKSTDKVDILFYKGTENDDTAQFDIVPVLERGDDIQIVKTNTFNVDQDIRTIYDLSYSDKLETNLYTGNGISNEYRPINILRQKRDKKVNGIFESKVRDSLETLIYPTSRIIKNIGLNDTDIFVDNSIFFTNGLEGDTPSAIIVNTSDGDPIAAAATAVVSAAGTISSIVIADGSSGYTVTPTVSISAPISVGATTVFYPDGSTPITGIGSVAKATVTLQNGSVSSIEVDSNNVGFGYSQSNPPKVLVSLPPIQEETVYNINSVTVKGYSGIITGISTTTVGSNLAIEFDLYKDSSFTDADYNKLESGNPVYIFDTTVGNGITSLDSSLNVVSTGTSYLNNIYELESQSPISISNLAGDGFMATITCIIDPNSNIIGIETSGSIHNPVGRFSWGKLAIDRNSISSKRISIATTSLTVTSSGLSTFPTIQRRGSTGLRKTGALKK